MTDSERFKPIQRIAEKKERDAATVFGKSLQAREAAKRRLEELRQYHAEYLARFTRATQSGIGAARVREYQVFIDRLELAIVEQQRILSDSEHRVDDSRAQWRGKYTKARAVDNAVDRMKAEEQRLREKREQKDTDERNQRR